MEGANGQCIKVSLSAVCQRRHGEHGELSFATDLTPLWAALGGGIVVGAGTIITQTFSNGAARDRTDREITHQENEAQRQRAHEIELDERRSARTMRQEVYPKIAAAMQEVVTYLTENALAAMSGNAVKPRSLTLDSPEHRAAWSRRVAPPHGRFARLSDPRDSQCEPHPLCPVTLFVGGKFIDVTERRQPARE